MRKWCHSHFPFSQNQTGRQSGDGLSGKEGSFSSSPWNVIGDNHLKPDLFYIIVANVIVAQLELESSQTYFPSQSRHQRHQNLTVHHEQEASNPGRAWSQQRPQMNVRHQTRLVKNVCLSKRTETRWCWNQIKLHICGCIRMLGSTEEWLDCMNWNSPNTEIKHLTLAETFVS